MGTLVLGLLAILLAMIIFGRELVLWVLGIVLGFVVIFVIMVLTHAR